MRTLSCLHNIHNSATLCCICGSAVTYTASTRAASRNSSTLKILLIWSISDFPGKSGFWVRSSPNMQPTDHMSTAVEYSCRGGNGHNVSAEKCAPRGPSIPGCLPSAIDPHMILINRIMCGSSFGNMSLGRAFKTLLQEVSPLKGKNSKLLYEHLIQQLKPQITQGCADQKRPRSG